MLCSLHICKTLFIQEAKVSFARPQAFCQGGHSTTTLMPVYHSHKPVFRPKMTIFRMAGMREGELPLPLAFQYLILMV